MFSIHDGTFINISSVTTDPLFYSNSIYNNFYGSLFSNISAEIIFYYDVKLFSFCFSWISYVLFHLYMYLYIEYLGVVEIYDCDFRIINVVDVMFNDDAYTSSNYLCRMSRSTLLMELFIEHRI